MDDRFRPAGGAAALFPPLARQFPALRRHRCCLDLGLGEGLAAPAGEEPDSVDVPHLLEHLIIDFQHFVADMDRCSGITCGYIAPPHRYDLFVESPDRRVSRLAATIAVDSMNRLLRAEAPSTGVPESLRLARLHWRRGGHLVAGPPGGPAERLSRLGFVAEIPMAMNFSSVPLFRLAPADAESPDALDLGSAGII